MITMCLDIHKPFSDARALRAKEGRVGEEVVMISRGPTKKVLGAFNDFVYLF